MAGRPDKFVGGVGERVGGGCDAKPSHSHGSFSLLTHSRKSWWLLNRIASFSFTLCCFIEWLVNWSSSYRTIFSKFFCSSSHFANVSSYTPIFDGSLLQRFLFMFFTVLSLSQARLLHPHSHTLPSSPNPPPLNNRIIPQLHNTCCFLTNDASGNCSEKVLNYLFLSFFGFVVRLDSQSVGT